MRWPWRRASTHEAREGREQAEQELAEVRARRGEVHEAAAQMRRHFERNHIADKIRLVYQGNSRER